MHKLRNGSKGDSNPGSLDCESGILPLSYRAQYWYTLYVVERTKFASDVERGSSVVECRTRNQVIPGSNPPLLPFRRLGIFDLSIDAPVDSAV